MGVFKKKKSNDNINCEAGGRVVRTLYVLFVKGAFIWSFMSSIKYHLVWGKAIQFFFLRKNQFRHKVTIVSLCTKNSNFLMCWMKFKTADEIKLTIVVFPCNVLHSFLVILFAYVRMWNNKHFHLNEKKRQNWEKIVWQKFYPLRLHFFLFLNIKMDLQSVTFVESGLYYNKYTIETHFMYFLLI